MFGELGIPELTALIMIASMALVVLWPATRIYMVGGGDRASSG